MNSLDSGYGAIFCFESCLPAKCGTLTQSGSHSLGYSASNWATFTWRQCLKRGHSHLETEPQTGPHSLGGSASNRVMVTWKQSLKSGPHSLEDVVSNWVIVTWIQSLKLGHIHLETVLQSGAQWLEYIASNRVTILAVSKSSCVRVTWSQWLYLRHNFFERVPIHIIINFQRVLLIRSDSLWDNTSNWIEMAVTVYPTVDHITRIRATCN
jgi:hypothetical protein